jgi:hypothetical protein
VGGRISSPSSFPLRLSSHPATAAFCCSFQRSERLGPPQNESQRWARRNKAKAFAINTRNDSPTIPPSDSPNKICRLMNLFPVSRRENPHNWSEQHHISRTHSRRFRLLILFWQDGGNAPRSIRRINIKLVQSREERDSG